MPGTPEGAAEHRWRTAPAATHSTVLKCSLPALPPARVPRPHLRRQLAVQVLYRSLLEHRFGHVHLHRLAHASKCLPHPVPHHSELYMVFVAAQQVEGQPKVLLNVAACRMMPGSQAARQPGGEQVGNQGRRGASRGEDRRQLERAVQRQTGGSNAQTRGFVSSSSSVTGAAAAVACNQAPAAAGRRTSAACASACHRLAGDSAARARV
jgi:hypothetical protein